MGIFSGAVSATWYRTDGTCPSDARERFQRALKRYGFRPINAEKGESQSVGWVDPRDILSTDLNWDRLSVGPYVFLGMRVDRKAVPGVLFKAHMRKALKELAKEKKTSRISRTEKRAVEERVAAALLRESSPSVSVQEAVWNTATGEVWFGATAKSANEGFQEMFALTFEMELLPANPLIRAVELARIAGHPEGLASLRPSFWGTGPHVAAIHDVTTIGQEG
jgi:DNA recombination-dependent growth factor C